MDTDLSFFQTTPFFISIGVSILIVIATSIFFQRQSAEEEGRSSIEWKPIFRDIILSAIFTTMSWTIFPDFMKTITNQTLSIFSSAKEATTATKISLVGGSAPRTTTISTVVDDIDIRVGPPNF